MAGRVRQGSAVVVTYEQMENRALALLFASITAAAVAAIAAGGAIVTSEFVDAWSITAWIGGAVLVVLVVFAERNHRRMQRAMWEHNLTIVTAKLDRVLADETAP
jgi:Na+/alanine symporter